LGGPLSDRFSWKRKSGKLLEQLKLTSYAGPMAFDRDQSTAIKLKFIHSMGGQTIGLVCIVLGFALFMNGITGSTSWTTQLFGLRSQVNDAPPGILLALIGAIIIFITNFKPKMSYEEVVTEKYNPETGEIEKIIVKR